MPDSIESVVTWHAEDAAILWIQRGIAARAPHYDLDDLAQLDQRLDAHLDGLVVNGEAGWQAARHELRWREAGEIFTATALALLTDPSRLPIVLAAVNDDAELEQAVADALSWLPDPLARPVIDALSSSGDPARLRPALLARVGLRQAEERPLLEAAASADPRLQAMGLYGLGAMGLGSAAERLRSQLHAGGDEPSFAAAWSLARLTGDPEAQRVLRRIAESAGVRGDAAAEMVVRWLPGDEAAMWVQSLAARHGRPQRAIQAAAARGTPELLDWLIACMADPQLARPAGEAFARITGVDLAADGYEALPPPGLEAGPTGDPRDEAVALDSNERLPWPDTVRLADWWSRQRGTLDNNRRYLLGQEINDTVCNHLLRAGHQRLRAAAAMELALREPGRPMFNVELPVWRQRQLLPTT